MHVRALGLALVVSLVGAWGMAQSVEQPPRVRNYRELQAKVLHRARAARGIALRGARLARDTAVRNARRCVAIPASH